MMSAKDSLSVGSSWLAGGAPDRGGNVYLPWRVLRPFRSASRRDRLIFGDQIQIVYRYQPDTAAQLGPKVFNY